MFDTGQEKIIDWLAQMYMGRMKEHEQRRAERKANYGNLGFGKKQKTQQSPD